jgi:hypothetical protein
VCGVNKKRSADILWHSIESRADLLGLMRTNRWSHFPEVWMNHMPDDITHDHFVRNAAGGRSLGGNFLDIGEELNQLMLAQVQVSNRAILTSHLSEKP